MRPGYSTFKCATATLALFSCYKHVLFGPNTSDPLSFQSTFNKQLTFICINIYISIYTHTLRKEMTLGKVVGGKKTPRGAAGGILVPRGHETRKA
jgi:hypothetical protein